MLRDAGGNSYRLAKLLGKGGEGNVFAIEGAPNLVAKVYHNPLSKEKLRKLRAMSEAQTPQIMQFAAWPISPLFNEDAPAGLLMPLVAAHEDIHHLYSPKSRKQHFPEANFRFIVQAATNTCRAFAATHALGCVIGDVNHGSVLVAKDATVKLVDCDSFQFTSDGNIFPCVVGTPTFTPRELQGKKLSSVVRTTDHDCFGLAILVFQLLFMGRHPFSGRFEGAGDMPIEKAIAEGRYAYSANVKATKMSPPPGAPPIGIASSRMASMFQHSFVGNNIGKPRPSAKEWVDELSEYARALRQCSSNPSHWFVSDQKGCPWCDIEAMTGTILFFYSTTPSSTPAAHESLASLWQSILSVGDLGPPPALPSEAGSPPKAWSSIPRRPFRLLTEELTGFLYLVIIGGTLAGMAAWGGGVFFAGVVAGAVLASISQETDAEKRHKEVRQALQATLNAAETKWRTLKEGWGQTPSSLAFRETRSILTNLHNQAKTLPEERQRHLQGLERNRRSKQLAKFLDRYSIESATIQGIGPGRKATLASYGIETAADIQHRRVQAVPGFGNTLTFSLMGWRREIERKFRFDPNRGVDPREVASLDKMLADRKQDLIQQLHKGREKLVRVRAQASKERADDVRKAHVLLREIAQARANKSAAD